MSRRLPTTGSIHQTPANANSTTPRPIRCAIYTRKSTEEGLDAEFNSLDAQREAGEAFVASQRHEGWVVSPERYDDGGFSGGSIERPALQRLLADVAANRVDCVVVYKVDRLSRSLLDFARLMDQFDRSKVSFVAVTQQFNSATSMGRLVLNVLLSFAQFEREIIGERTRDKMAAMRRKGKWSGGLPPLGYDRDSNSKLVVNPTEAERVRQIFDLYLEHGSLLPVVKVVEARGWTNKRTETRRGTTRGGQAITRTTLHRMLTNEVYVGKIRYRNELHHGEHEGIVDPGVFREVGLRLHRHGRTGGSEDRTPSNHLLQGVLRCTACDASMSPTHTKKGSRRYGYYVCTNAAKRGYDVCPAKSVPAGGIERAVLERLRDIGRDDGLVAETTRQVRELIDSQTRDAAAKVRDMERERRRAEASIRDLSLRLADAPDPAALRRLADERERLTELETALGAEKARRQADTVAPLAESDVRAALRRFDDVWEHLTLKERNRAMKLLLQRVEFDGRTQTVSLVFHPESFADANREHDEGEER